MTVETSGCWGGIRKREVNHLFFRIHKGGNRGRPFKFVTGHVPFWYGIGVGNWSYSGFRWTGREQEFGKTPENPSDNTRRVLRSTGETHIHRSSQRCKFGVNPSQRLETRRPVGVCWSCSQFFPSDSLIGSNFLWFFFSVNFRYSLGSNLWPVLFPVIILLPVLTLFQRSTRLS